MTQEPSTQEVGLGLCLKDGNVWCWSDGRRICIMCGKPPTYIIAVANGGAEQPADSSSAEAPASAPPSPTLIGVTCPHCDKSITLEISDQAVAVVPPTFPDVQATTQEPAPPEVDVTPQSEPVPAGDAAI